MGQNKLLAAENRGMHGGKSLLWRRGWHKREAFVQDQTLMAPALSKCRNEPLHARSVALTLMSTCRGQGASEAADGGVDVHTGLLAESQLERSLVECQHSGFCSQPHQALCERSFIQYASGQCAARRHAEACRSDSLVPHDWQ